MEKIIRTFALIPYQFYRPEILPEHVPLKARVRKKFQRFSSLNGGDIGVKEKFSPHAPSISPRSIRSKFYQWLALDAPYNSAEDGAHNGHDFLCGSKNVCLTNAKIEPQ